MKEDGNGLSFLYLNIRSLPKHFEELEATLSCLDKQPSIVCLTETWITAENDGLYLLKGFDSEVSKIRDNRGGGVSIQIGKPANFVRTIDCPFPEAVGAEIEVSNERFLVFCFYCPPKTNKLSFTLEFDNFLEHVSNTGKKVMIFGDFNIDILKDNLLIRNYIDAIHSNGFKVLNYEATRVAQHSRTCIDHVISNFPVLKEPSLLNFNISDHYPIRCEIATGVTIKCPEEFTQYTFFRDVNELCKFKFLLAHNISKLPVLDDVDEDFSQFISCIQTTISRFTRVVPRKKNVSQPWFDKSLRNLMNKRDRFHRMWRLTGSQPSREKFIILRNRVSAEIRRRKKFYYSEKFTTSMNDPSKFYKLFNEVCGSRERNTSISCLSTKETQTSDSQAMAAIFNEHFVSIGKTLSECIGPIPNEVLGTRVPQSFFLMPTTSMEVQKIISKLKSKNSVGIDRISSRVLKVIGEVVAPYLTNLINKSFVTGKFPECLKTAKVIPIHKEGSKMDVNNYRPISVLPSISKVIEKLMYNRINVFLERFIIISNQQFGFRSNCSTIDALSKITEKIRWEINKGNVTSCVFMDLKKAFDTIDHCILLKKLEYIGVRGLPNDWFRSYLSDRKQYTTVNGASSICSSICCGVPQGSILGPLLFIIYINDITQTCSSFQPYLFADDTNLLYCGPSDTEAINVDAIQVTRWFKANKLSLNIQKTKQVNIKVSNSNKLPPIEIDNQPLNIVKSCKYLGLHIDETLMFDPHIEFVRQKLRRACGMISKLRHVVPRHVLLKYYISNFAPIIHYGILIYGCTTFHKLEPILKIQKRAIRLIHFKSPRDSTYELFFHLRVLTVHELFIYELLKFVIKSIVKTHRCSDLNSIYSSVSHVRSSRSQSQQLIKVPRCFNSTQKRSLAFRGANLLNYLKSIGYWPVNEEELAEPLCLRRFLKRAKIDIILQNHALMNSVFR